MTSSGECGFQEQRLRYLGEVTASMSHEINNVLAIISELSGLVDDLVLGAGESGFDTARVKTIGAKIAGHVERGKGYVGTLNRFAHSVDESWSTFDTGASVGAVVAVCDRFARLRRAELRMGRSDGWPELTGSLCDFEHLVFRALGAALLTVERGGTVTVELHADGGVNRVEVASIGPTPEAVDPELAARLTLIESLAEHLGVGFVQPAVGERNLALELALPKVLEARFPERSS